MPPSISISFGGSSLGLRCGCTPRERRKSVWRSNEVWAVARSRPRSKDSALTFNTDGERKSVTRLSDLSTTATEPVRPYAAETPLLPSAGAKSVLQELGRPPQPSASPPHISQAKVLMSASRIRSSLGRFCRVQLSASLHDASRDLEAGQRLGDPRVEI